MFAIDFNKVRSVVREGLDVIKSNAEKSKRVLARRTLWGVLQTHMKMKEYIRIGIKNHPSISSEYVRFLIQKASLGRVARLENENKLLKDQLKEVEGMAKEAKRKGETAMNRADETKRIAQKNDWDGTG